VCCREPAIALLFRIAVGFATAANGSAASKVAWVGGGCRPLRCGGIRYYHDDIFGVRTFTVNGH